MKKEGITLSVTHQGDTQKIEGKSIFGVVVQEENIKTIAVGMINGVDMISAYLQLKELLKILEDEPTVHKYIKNTSEGETS